jgi:hypothetical protein
MHSYLRGSVLIRIAICNKTRRLPFKVQMNSEVLYRIARRATKKLRWKNEYQKVAKVIRSVT